VIGNISLSEINKVLRNYHIGLLYFDDKIYDNYLPHINIVEPNKLYDYYFAELPIFCNNNSIALNKIINEYKLGLTHNFYEKNDLYSQLSDLIQNYKFNNKIYLPFDDKENENIINTLIRKY